MAKSFELHCIVQCGCGYTSGWCFGRIGCGPATGYRERCIRRYFIHFYGFDFEHKIKQKKPSIPNISHFGDKLQIEMRLSTQFDSDTWKEGANSFILDRIE